MTEDGPRSVAIDEWSSGAWHQIGWAKTALAGEGVTYRVVLPGRTALTAGTLSTRFTIRGVLYRSDPRKVAVSVALDASVSGPLTRAAVPYSYRAGCPVGPASLRRLTLTYLDYTGHYRRGSIILHKNSVASVTAVFARALQSKFPFKKLVPVDAYYRLGKATPTQSDVAQMNDGDTMAFNCRPVTGNPYRISQHAYGNAIDINCFENPYVTTSHVYPATARRYLTRWPYRTGMILRGGPVATAMAQRGWLWGARWAHPDYQHFSSNGG
ncbi:MAG: M15 family metallopeptidase [Actinomycetales bacterium]